MPLQRDGALSRLQLIRDLASQLRGQLVRVAVKKKFVGLSASGSRTSVGGTRT